MKEECVPLTYHRLCREFTDAFAAAGYPAATLEARELVGFAAGKNRETLFRDATLYVPSEVEAMARTLARRHLAGEPVAYLLGEWEFYGLPLDITPAVLIPRPDTEILAGEAAAYMRRIGSGQVLDLCTGSGCVGLAIAKHVPECQVICGDVSREAVQICRRNIQRNGLEGRVSARVLDVREPPPPDIGVAQCIVCNPPYIPQAEWVALDISVREYEPRLALDGGADGYDFFRAVLRHWRSILATGGQLYFEVGWGQAATVAGLLRNAGFSSVSTVLDTQGIERVVHGTRQDI